MKILLISPGTSDDIDSRIIRQIPYLSARAFFAPHAVAAVAALTPPEHEVVIYDEYVKGPVDEYLHNSSFDIIGITITTNQLKHCMDIAGMAKTHNPSSVIVVGGIGAAGLVSKGNKDIDVVFHGEAEDTWKIFLEDYKSGNYRKLYKSVSKPDMTRAPAPRWELIAKDISMYNAVSVQTTRGCPFDCSFCDVIYTYGRKPRSKTIPQVLEEIRKLEAMKVKMIFIADDNFAGDKKYTKELLKHIVELNNSFRTPIGFLTQLDITIAGDEELLSLLADGNFYAVMIGIESVNEDSLREMNKKQNLNVSLIEAVRKIQSYGIIVLAHMIIGADSDDASVFKKTADFVSDANIVLHFCHPLNAPPGTRMWYDYKRQGRIISVDQKELNDKLDIISNIVPKRMSRVEFFEGLADYWESVFDSGKFEQRAIAFIEGITQKSRVKAPGLASVWRLRNMLFNVFRFFLFKVDPQQRKAFLNIIQFAIKRDKTLIPKVIYMFTFYLMDYKRSMHDADVSRKHAQWERENPDMIKVESRIIPVSEKIRENATEIYTMAYQHVRKTFSHKETLYNIVLQALIDFNDRFGESLVSFDDDGKEFLLTCCDRIISNQIPSFSECTEELQFQPPPGFVREISDALDSAVRYRNL